MILRTIFTVLFLSCAAFGQISEGFESGLPATAPTSPLTVTLGSGDWVLLKGMQSTTKHSGLYGLNLNGGSAPAAYIATRPLTGIVSTTFWVRGSGASSMKIQKSLDGTTYTDVMSITITSSFMQYTVAVNDTNANVRLRYYNGTSQTHYLDDVEITALGSLPTVNVAPTAIPSFGLVLAGTVSASSSYTVSGVNLAGGITITAPAAFQISTDNTSFVSELSLPQSSGIVQSTPVYVRFNPSVALGNVTAVINHQSAGAQVKGVSVNGIAIAAEPTQQPNVSLGAVTGSTIVINFSGGNGERRVVIAKADSATTWNPADGNTLSGVSTDFSAALDQENGNKAVYDGAGNTVTVTGLSVARTYHFTVFEYNGSAPSAANYLTLNPGRISGTTLVEPGLTVEPSMLNFGSVVVGTSSTEKAYILSARYLTPPTGDISVSAPAGFLVSSASGGSFTSTLTVPYANGVLAQTSVYVRFSPGALGLHKGEISNAGGGAAAKNVNASGIGIDSSILFIKTYFVSPVGNDANPGTIDAPLYSISQAVLLAAPGDTIYVRGGTFQYSTTIRLTQSGTAAKRIHILAYKDEKPVLDFSTQPFGSSNRGVLITGDYWYIRGLEIIRAGDNGIKIEGSHNKIELCVFHHNQDSGLQIGFGHTTPNPGGLLAAYNEIINCDSYRNFDQPTLGGNADGFACKMHNGKGNVFRGCRGWENSDDGWDLYETDWPVEILNCWTWHNGDKSLFPAMSSFSGNGNGFKLGGNGTGGSSEGTHVVKNSVAFNNNFQSKKGFDQNSHKGGVTVHNCLSFGNGYNYMFEDQPSSGFKNEFKNCVSFAHRGTLQFEFESGAILVANSWNLNLTPSMADFMDTTEASAKAPRQPDGSLPNNGFARLKAGSILIDKGVNVGLPFAGVAPDLGAYEYGLASGFEETGVSGGAESYFMLRNYPNPFNPSTTIQFIVPENGLATVTVYDVLGNIVQEIFRENIEAGEFRSIPFRAGTASSGIYFAVLRQGAANKTIRMILIK